MAYGPQFLSEHRSLFDFQIGNEHYMAYGAHFLFETGLMIDFKVEVSPMVSVPVFRPPGDFPYPNFARGRDLDFLYTNVSLAVGIDCSMSYTYFLFWQCSTFAALRGGSTARCCGRQGRQRALARGATGQQALVAR